MILKYTGTEWVSVGSSAGVSAGIMLRACLAIGSDSMPYVGYSDGANNYHFTVLSYK
jgi:hypothetical protein